MKSKPAYLTLLLALLHGVAGITILVISSWFIAISAIAPVGFNYVIPAVVIRALALLRIASGYASMWVGHNDLLARIAGVRLRVFRQLENNKITDKAFTTEALAQHTEELASRWIAWIAPLSNITFIFTNLCVVAVWFNLPGTSFLITLFAIWLVAVVVQGLGALNIAKRVTKENKAFRQQSADFLNCSAIWHLNKAMNDMPKEEGRHVINSAPTAHSVWQQQTAQKDKAQRANWWFQGAAFSTVVLVMSGVLSSPSEVSYMPIAIIVPMILLAAPDWAGAAFHCISRFAQHKQSVKALKSLKTTPIQVIENTELQHSLTLFDFAAKNRRLPLVSATFPAVGIVSISGASGCGKSSLLQSIAGVLPSTGIKEVDGMRLPDGLITNWRYVEQEPIVLSGSVSSNLDPAGMGIPVDDMTNLLAQLGLEALLPLSMWVGKAGRALSGGERKRLALARAILSHANVLLVDEPFEGLDVPTQHKVCDVLNRYAANHLILVASHVTPSTLNVSSTLSLGEGSVGNLSKGQRLNMIT
ncbi:ATP-binding cassette domain-containing protein [Alteromonas abrolhosensis]|uniref:ATP-binding cassette domain-containing protein n=1 Tax=Alteromonas abrolhosensis TaxID=1892904 RepID=UPI0035198FDD